jgi:hypothetical protein
MKQRRPARRKQFRQPAKRLPVPSDPPPTPRTQPGPEILAWHGLDQTAAQVRAAHEERTRRGFDAISSGTISENPPLPAAAVSGALDIKEAPDQAQSEGEVAWSRSVQTNRIAIVLSIASLMVLIDERLAQLRDERPNAKDAQALRDDAIARYESIRRAAEALRNAADEGGGINEQKAKNAAKSFWQCVHDWWNERHVEICSRVFDAGLFVSCVAVCSLVGSGGPVTVAVTGALIGGKPVIEALKAIAPRRHGRKRS